ncbi:MAG: Ig-like domain-containing protein [Chloroflexota bacterium]
MFEKLLLLLLQGKGLVVAGTLATGMVVTGTVGSGVVSQILTAAPESAPVVAIDRPTLGEDVVVSPDTTGGTFVVTGWALDTKSEDGTGIAKVELYLNDPSDAANKLGEATLGEATPAAVLAQYHQDEADERFDKAGWTFDWDVSDLSEGNHTLYVVAHSSVNTTKTATASVQINDPLVAFVSPQAGDEVSGLVTITGTAVDRFENTDPTTDAQILEVELSLDGASLGLADVATNGEWEFIWDASALTPGEYMLTATARSAAQDGASSEATLLLVVFEPNADKGEGCGWIVGQARGDAVQALHTGWLVFHQLAMGYNGNIGSADFDQRRELITEVQSTREGLNEIRMEALLAIHAKAEEYLGLCLNGTLSTLDGQTFVTVEQDVVDTSHLLYEFRSIVDQAMVDMQEFYDEAKTKLETLSTGTGATPGGKPEGAGQPEGTGKPEGTGQPEGTGKPEDAGKPEGAGRP